MLARLKQFLPERIKSTIRRSPLWARKSAGTLARSSKRLDLCSSQFALWLHLTGNPPLRGKVCLELGSGWVLTHAIVCHLLGAKGVIATDVEDLARPSSLRAAIHKAIPSLVRDTLSPFCDHGEIRRRLDRLLATRRFTLDTLKSIGIEYLAPVDLARRGPDILVDFIYSNSVLEHVPVEDVTALLENLTSLLRPGGTMIHAIHLEDHRDTESRPFAFLSEPAKTYTRAVQTRRGNRIRASRWRDLFCQTKGLDPAFFYEWIRRDRDLPETIDSSVVYEDETDLRTSNVGVYAVKGADGK